MFNFIKNLLESYPKHWVDETGVPYYQESKNVLSRIDTTSITKEDYIAKKSARHPYQCKDCMAEQYDYNPGYAAFCDKDKPTWIPNGGMSIPEAAMKYGIPLDQIRKETTYK